MIKFLVVIEIIAILSSFLLPELNSACRKVPEPCELDGRQDADPSDDDFPAAWIDGAGNKHRLPLPADIGLCSVPERGSAATSLNWPRGIRRIPVARGMRIANGTPISCGRTRFGNGWSLRFRNGPCSHSSLPVLPYDIPILLNCDNSAGIRDLPEAENIHSDRHAINRRRNFASVDGHVQDGDRSKAASCVFLRQRECASGAPFARSDPGCRRL